MTQDKVSNELQAIQDAWEICNKYKKALYPNDVTSWLPQDPITQSAFGALVGAQTYLQELADNWVTGVKK